MNPKHIFQIIKGLTIYSFNDYMASPFVLLCGQIISYCDLVWLSSLPLLFFYNCLVKNLYTNIVIVIIYSHIFFAVRLLVSMVLAFFRFKKSIYTGYLELLSKCSENPCFENYEEVSRYHTDFTSYPLAYTCQKSSYIPSDKEKDLFTRVKHWLIHYLLYIVIYPGSLWYVNLVQAGEFRKNRDWLIKKGGIRFKIRNASGNYTDTIYFKKKGQPLVILCTGNSSYYETLLYQNPVIDKYAVLGWNHSGYGCSTGWPTMKSEQDAVLGVIEFATNYLNYEISDIIVYGFSIGSYTASFTGTAVPGLRGIILDGGIDSIKQLFDSYFSSMGLGGIIEPVIDEYFNYNNPLNILRAYKDTHYFIIIRCFDEALCTSDYRDNPGLSNALAALKKRYESDKRSLPETLNYNFIWNTASYLEKNKEINSEKFLKVMKEDEYNFARKCLDQTVALIATGHQEIIMLQAVDRFLASKNIN